MKIDLDFFAKLFAPFHTEVGKQLALEYVKRKNVNPDCVVNLPPADPAMREPKGDKEKKAEESVVVINDAGMGMIDNDRFLQLRMLAREDAKPTLLKMDIQSLEKAFEADKWYFYQQRGFEAPDSYVYQNLRCKPEH